MGIGLTFIAQIDKQFKSTSTDGHADSYRVLLLPNKIYDERKPWLIKPNKDKGLSISGWDRQANVFFRQINHYRNLLSEIERETSLLLPNGPQRWSQTRATTPYSPKQNGMVKRVIRTLKD